MIYIISSLCLRQKNNKIVIALYRTKDLEGNLKYIYDELIKEMPDAKIHLVRGENKMNLRLFKEVILLSNTKYLILDDYYLPIYLIKPRKTLKVIQLWHAAGAFKKFGWSTLGTKFGSNQEYLNLVPIHSNYTNVYVSTEKVIDFYADAFNMDSNKIYPLGIPRIDLFNQPKECAKIIEKIKKDNPQLQEDKVNVLVAPTYRAKGAQEESTFDFISLLSNVSKTFNKNIRIIFKPHPYMNEKSLAPLQEVPNIIIAKKYSINEWMLLSDAFITDYSSSIFEFSLLKRPLAHVIPDLDEYTKNRGFYQDIDVISDGKIINNQQELVEWINSRHKNEYFDTSNMIRNNFDYVEDVTVRIVNHILQR
ncbi:CDP-glycerol glycerophosphotransferase family protein [Virgibacillus sp. SK37]|uniref:CDP-glycerol glycerophosphotransferase family protein n=1 Tax=Virgibacillus sp. SK37 TaxID=403957 RepID=UPI0014448A96|nr:CDP-glycerol glycerophosphotransferase family protein [Virgibacillus sp. SK37]